MTPVPRAGLDVGMGAKTMEPLDGCFPLSFCSTESGFWPDCGSACGVAGVGSPFVTAAAAMICPDSCAAAGTFRQLQSTPKSKAGSRTAHLAFNAKNPLVPRVLVDHFSEKSFACCPFTLQMRRVFRALYSISVEVGAETPRKFSSGKWLELKRFLLKLKAIEDTRD